jgi:hypothetical protein
MKRSGDRTWNTTGARPGAWWRLGLGAVATAGLVACGGGGSADTPPPVAVNEAAVATAQSGEVLTYVKRTLAARGPQGVAWQAFGDMPVWLDVATTASGTVSRAGTVVQEAGVDEDDLIKTDGQRIYTLQPLTNFGEQDKGFAHLTVHTLGTGGLPQVAGTVLLRNADVDWTFTRGMLLAETLPRLAVLSEGTNSPVSLPDCREEVCISTLPYRPTAPRVLVNLVDATRADQPAVADRLQIDGRLVGSRQIGNMLYVVVSHTPSFNFDLLPASATERDRTATLDRMTVADVMPRISVNGAPSVPLVAETDCWLQPTNASTQVAVTTITAIDMGSAGWTRSSRCFVGGTDALYMSTASVVLATSRYPVQTFAGRQVFAPEMRTDLHKFSVSGANIAYRGSGSVAGHLGWDGDKRAYRISEHQGDLRVLTYTGSVGWLNAADANAVPASPALLTVLRENAADASLRTVATLPNAQRPALIGKPGEQVYAVRFVGDRGYVVTFRQTDPLYVLDLSNPADPRTAGALEVPGFSDWLFPLDGGLLFGVGKEATGEGRTQGVKVALFDVRDAAQPRLLDSRVYGLAGSSSGLDYSAHGIARLDVGGHTRLALPLLLMDGNNALPAMRLQGFEIDTVARSLQAKPSIDLGSGWRSLASDRSLLLNDRVYHLSDGLLQSWVW